MAYMLPLTMQFYNRYKCVFLHVNVNSKEIVNKYPFVLFSRKMLMPAFLLRFKANYLKKCVATPIFLCRFQ